MIFKNKNHNLENKRLIIEKIQQKYNFNFNNETEFNCKI